MESKDSEIIRNEDANMCRQQHTRSGWLCGLSFATDMNGNINAVLVLSMPILALLGVIKQHVRWSDFRRDWWWRLLMIPIIMASFFPLGVLVFGIHKCGNGQPGNQIMFTMLSTVIAFAGMRSGRVRRWVITVIFVVGVFAGQHFARLIHTPYYLGTTDLSYRSQKYNGAKGTTPLWHTNLTGLYTLTY